MIRKSRIATGALFTILQSMVEDPYTEMYNTLTGSLYGNEIHIRRAFNWHSTINTRDGVYYGNLEAKKRIIAMDESLHVHRPGKNYHYTTKIVGDAHSHPKPCSLEPSDDDLSDAYEWMKIAGAECWLSFITQVKLIQPRKLAAEFYKEGGVLSIRVENTYRGFGIEANFEAYCIEHNAIRTVRKIPILLDEKSLKRHLNESLLVA